MAKGSNYTSFDGVAGLRERGVPFFDGQSSKWKEYEKSANMLLAKLTLEKKELEAALLPATDLAGEA
eukprot:1051056-Pyramimonas_sp.AAC.1